MKRVMSFLLALMMVVAMLPAGTVSVSAAGAEPLQAYYTDKTISVEGTLREEHWLLRDRVGNTPIALLNSQEALYVAMQTTENVVELTVNGKAVKVDVAAGAVQMNGEKVGAAARDMQAGTIEFEIPLNALNLIYSLRTHLLTESINGKTCVLEVGIKVKS